MLNHDDGINWLKQEKAWKRAVNYCIQDQTIYVVRRAKEFIVDFSFNITDDDTLCLEMMTEILRPVSENVYIEHSGNVTVDSCDLKHKVLPSLNLVSNLLDRYIKVNKKSSIVQHILTVNRGYKNFWKLADMTTDRTLYSAIVGSLIYMSFAVLVDTLHENATPDGSFGSLIDFNKFGLHFLNLCKFCILKNQIEPLLNSTRLYYTLWRSMSDRVPEEIILGNQLINFENQVILFQILPVLSVLNPIDTCHPELLDEYYLKLFQVIFV